MMNYNILSLDQSTSCTGYSISNLETGFIKSGSIVPEGDNSADKIYDLTKKIEKMCKDYDIKIASLEGIWLNTKLEEKHTNFKPNKYAKRGKDLGDNVSTLITLGRLLGSLEMSFKRVGILRYKIIPPVTWKSSFKILGKGIDRNKQKELAWCYAKRINPYVKTEDECEAILMNVYLKEQLMKIVEDSMKAGEFKVKDGDKVYPHIFALWNKKDYNELSEKTGIKITKEVKVIIGKSDNGKNKWGTEIKEFYVSELSQLPKELKLQFMDKLKARGFKSRLAELVYEVQLKNIVESD